MKHYLLYVIFISRNQVKAPLVVGFSGINGLSILCQKEELTGAEPENSERGGRDD